MDTTLLSDEAFVRHLRAVAQACRFYAISDAELARLCNLATNGLAAERLRVNLGDPLADPYVTLPADSEPGTPEAEPLVLFDHRLHGGG